MIVVSGALALSLSTERSANNPIIGYRNVIASGNVTADSEMPNYPASNLANPATDLTQRWRSDSSDDQYLYFEITVEDAIDYLAVARHNFGSGQIVVSIEIPDPEDPEGTIELIPETQPGDDAPLIFRFPATYTGELYFRMQPQGDVKPWASVFYLGKLLVSERGIYVGHTPLPFARRIEVANGRTQRGDFLGQIVTAASLGTQVSLQNLKPQFHRNEFEPFVAACRSKSGVRPFFFAWRPQKYPLEVGFAWLTDDPQPRNQRVNGMMQVDFNIEAIA